MVHKLGSLIIIFTILFIVFVCLTSTTNGLVRKLAKHKIDRLFNSGFMKKNGRDPPKNQNPLVQPCPAHPSPITLPIPLPLEIRERLALFESKIELAMNITNTTAATIGITFNGDIIYSKSLNTESNFTATLDTPFRIGSLSKIFANLFLMHCRDM